MITYEDGDIVFNFRVVGIALNDGKVLLHQLEGQDFWALPGGRAEPMEPSGDTLRREMLEELGERVSVGRLVFAVENFYFELGKRYHEIGLYYLMEFQSYVMEERRGLDDRRLVFRWFPLDELEDVPLYPSFLVKRLGDLPEGTEHVVHIDM